MDVYLRAPSWEKGFIDFIQYDLEFRAKKKYTSNLCSNDFFILGKRRRIFQPYFVWGEINKMPVNEHTYLKAIPRD